MSKNTSQISVTFALFSYNQERYIREAVEAALDQDYKDMDIIISDDCSDDSTFEIIESIASTYRGPHRLTINKNYRNLGWVSHFNKVVNMANGEIIVVAAGDDISTKDRTKKTIEAFSRNPKAALVSLGTKNIDHLGRVQNKQTITPPEQDSIFLINDYVSGRMGKLSGASRGYKKYIFDEFQPLSNRCPTEDTTTLLRGIILGGAVLSRDTGVLYRKHATNLSSKASIIRMDIDEILIQKICDIEHAKASGIISPPLAEQLRKIVVSDHNERIIDKYRLMNKSKSALKIKNFFHFAKGLGFEKNI